MRISEAAVGKWPGILSALGVADEFLLNRHGPCPVCGGKDRYRFDDKNGKGGYYCGQCGSGDGFSLLMKINGWDFRQAARQVERIIGNVEAKPRREKADPRIRLRNIQEEACVASEAVERYLRGRGLTVVPPGLCQGLVDYYDKGKKSGRFMSMLGKVVAPSGKPLTWHVTYLKKGQKAPVSSPKKLMSAVSKISGGAIRLWPVAKHIGIAEGIETAIAAHEQSGVPMWSVVNSNGMKTFQPPAGVECVTIFADNDASYTGQAAAYECARRLVNAGLSVAVEVPPIIGDWLDVRQA